MPAPRKKSAASIELPSSTATRSPGLSPSPSRPLANLQPRSQACAKVSRSLPWTTASRSAKKTAARRIAVVTSMTSSRAFDRLTDNPQWSHHLCQGLHNRRSGQCGCRPREQRSEILLDPCEGAPVCPSDLVERSDRGDYQRLPTAEHCGTLSSILCQFLTRVPHGPD